ncbi:MULTISPECIES: MarC family protein [Cysteiniphilum]|uniref:MarC family protein n=1 Tax=Cysteiniphilum TaxID=2056696 RepID=UPI0017843EAC|nr:MULTISPECIES: MarC family protein [Cysteiniphilum]
MLSFAIALIVIMNPIGNLAIYIGLITGRDEQDCNKTAKICAIAIFVLLMISLWIGWPILNFFGISIGAFRLAGGLIVLRIALSMIQGGNHTHKKGEKKIDDEKQPSIAVVPMAIPVIAGPGAMAVIITHAHDFTLWQFLMASIICAVAAVFFWLLLKYTPKLARFLSEEALSVISRVMGLILAAIAIQMMAGGLTALFPRLH